MRKRKIFSYAIMPYWKSISHLIFQSSKNSSNFSTNVNRIKNIRAKVFQYQISQEIHRRKQMEVEVFNQSTAQTAI